MEMADDGRKKCRRVFTKDKLMTDTPRNVILVALYVCILIPVNLRFVLTT